MKPAISPEVKELLGTVKYHPSVSIIMPFEPKMSLKRELDQQLKASFQQVEKELKEGYPDEIVASVTAKLKHIIKNLDYSTFKKSIAIFVSPVVEKVFYLDMPVEKTTVVDDSFEIRDLVYSKKEIHKYLLLVLSEQQSRVYLGNTVQFLRIAFNVPAHMAAYTNDIPQRVSNFSTSASRKEVMLDKFMHHIDNGLSHILNAYPLPLFVMGAERTMGHFAKISHNLQHVIGFIPGNYEDASETEIQKTVAPYVADWKKVKQQDLLHQLDAAMGAHKLSTGIQDVWKEAAHQRGKLLVVEKNYTYAAKRASEKIINAEDPSTATTPFYIKDAVDDIIEKVLENGGDVEFVDEGVLKDFDRIALIKYY